MLFFFFFFGSISPAMITILHPLAVGKELCALFFCFAGADGAVLRSPFPTARPEGEVLGCACESQRAPEPPPGSPGLVYCKLGISMGKKKILKDFMLAGI